MVSWVPDSILFIATATAKSLHYVITKIVHSTSNLDVQEILVDQLNGWNCM